MKSSPALCIVLAALTAEAGRLPAQQSAAEAQLALQAGNRRYVAGQSAPQPLGEGVRRTLARGQSPYSIVVCCADSVAPPEHVFNAGLGDLYVVRLAGNVVDAEALASIEHAAAQFGTQLCVVLGHEGCDAIAACATQLLAGSQGQTTQAASEAQALLLQQLEPAVRRAVAQDLAGKALTDRAEEENAQAMAVEVLRRSKLLYQLARLGRFSVLPARIRAGSGEVEWLPPRPLPEPAGDTALLTAAPPTMAPHVALRLLQAGHRRFLGAGRPLGDIGQARRQSVAARQQPMAIVVTCSDSRLAPEHVFDAGLGELYVVRVQGSAFSDGVLASIEFAALHTGAPLLLVLGHTSCDALAAALEQGQAPDATPHLRALRQRLEPAIERARREPGSGRNLLAAATRANALRFVQQVRQQSSLLRELEAKGRFAMLPAVYDLGAGDIDWLKDEIERGEPPLPAQTAAPAGETAPAHGREELRTGGANAPPQRSPTTAHADLAWADEPATDEPRHGAGGAGSAAAGGTLAPTGDRPHAPQAAAADAADAVDPAANVRLRTFGMDPKTVLALTAVGSLFLAALLTLRVRR